MIASRLLVGAAVVLVLVAAADALRQSGGEASTSVGLPRLEHGDFALDRGAVELRGRPFLARGDLSRVFPGGARGRVAAERLARADDGTLLLGVRDDAGRSAVELWHGRVAVAAFRVPVGAYAGGLVLESPGGAIATFGVDGLEARFDHRGRRIAGADS